MTVYFDCAATTPLDPRVRERVLEVLDPGFANAGSRHAFGYKARQAVERGRDQLARALGARRGEVVFTSGATEANNIAVLGLQREGERRGHRHVLISAIEHKAVLEPAARLVEAGFSLELIPVDAGGRVDPSAVAAALRPDTLLVSVMQVNNETGVEQPIAAIADVLEGHEAFFHVDAAQGFGRGDGDALRRPRVDLISVSGHKIYAPQGIGALIARRRGGAPPPLTPPYVGGGQERGLRPGTLPAALIAGLGLAAELAVAEAEERAEACRRIRGQVLAGLAPLGPRLHGDQARCLPHILNLCIPGIDSESLLELWSEELAFSNGAACSSQDYTCSHVLAAMGLDEDAIDGAVRLSWYHGSTLPDFQDLVERLREIPL